LNSFYSKLGHFVVLQGIRAGKNQYIIMQHQGSLEKLSSLCAGEHVFHPLFKRGFKMTVAKTNTKIITVL